MTLCDILDRLRAQANPAGVFQMARFGINPTRALGVRIPVLRALAREIGRSHELALQLWATGIHEVRILASMIDEHKLVTQEQMEAWVSDFNSWDVCDQVCSNLFDKTPHAHAQAAAWAQRDEEFVKRAGFAMMACLAVHDKKATNQQFILFFPLIEAGAIDERNFVKKAVNWALRQIGKRNGELNEAAIALAKRIRLKDSASARWVAADALRELTGLKEYVQKRMNRVC